MVKAQPCHKNGTAEKAPGAVTCWCHHKWQWGRVQNLCKLLNMNVTKSHLNLIILTSITS